MVVSKGFFLGMWLVGATRKNCNWVYVYSEGMKAISCKDNFSILQMN